MLAEELSRLSQQQYEALQRASYFRMSHEAAAEYDKRRLRIGELCGRLAKFMPRSSELEETEK